MKKFEQRMIDSLIEHQDQLFLAVVTVIATVVRIFLLDFVSDDMATSLLRWFDKITSLGGLSALRQQVGDYNIFYQFIIALFTYLPVQMKVFQPLYLYKYLSITFDFLLAVSAAKLVAQLKQNNKTFWFNVTYTIIIMLPTVVTNSAMWGQCDSIFTCFLVLTLSAFLQKKDKQAFILYGVALVFKFQAIFLLPFILLYYIYTRRFSLTLFGWSLLMLWLSGVPGFLHGRQPLAPFTLYFRQSQHYEKMYMNVVSLWRLIGDDYRFFSGFALLFTVSLFGLVMYTLLKGYVKMDTPEQLLTVACWSLWTCVLFLPAMHERYTFPTDIIFILLAILNRKYLKFAIPETCFSLITYGYYFYGTFEVNIWCTLISLGLWTWFTAELLSAPIQKNRNITEETFS